MKNVVSLSVLVALCISGGAVGGAGGKSMTDIKLEPFKSPEYTVVQQVAKLPESVRADLKDMPMSDAGGPFNAGCCVTAGVPSARLIFAAVSSKRCILEYEQGGIAHWFRLVGYDISSGGAKAAPKLWSGMVPPPGAPDLTALNKLIESGKIQVQAETN